MQAVAPAQLVSLLVAAAVIVAMHLVLRWAVVRRNRRRARGFFVLGFSCGLLAGAFLRGRRRARRALRTVARRVGHQPRRPGIRGGAERFAGRVLILTESRRGPTPRVRSR